MRGRVMSMVSLGSVGLAPISLGISGAIVDLGAAALMFEVAGAIVVLASLLALGSGVAARMNATPEA